MGNSRILLEQMLQRRLEGRKAEWLEEAVAEVEGGVSGTRLAGLLSLASRFVPRQHLAPRVEEIDEAWHCLPGWNPERWTILEAVRVALILAHKDQRDSAFTKLLEECFRYADEGETCALLRSLALLPLGQRFLWRAGEGCRSNMRSIFEAAACDTPYPATFFDEPTWRQLVIKAVFIGAPLWRVHGMDDRLSPGLARMALDLADERQSAGREVQPELWLCLGSHGGERGLASLERELRSPNPTCRRAATLGLARAGHRESLRQFLQGEGDLEVIRTARDALDGRFNQISFRALDDGGL